MTVATILFLNKTAPPFSPELAASRHGRVLHSLDPPAQTRSVQEDLVHAEDAPPRAVPRRVAPNNQVVGGLVLHQTRAPASADCLQPFAAKLSYRCMLRQVVGSLLEGGEQASVAVEPYGVDPVFDSQSPLYSFDVAQNAWEYFNASAAAREVTPTGLPRAFFARPLLGHGDGFPIVIPVRSPTLLCIHGHGV